MELAICEIFSPQIHGITTNSSKGIGGHFVVYACVSLEDFYNSNHDELITMLRQRYPEVSNAENFIQHPCIRNYHHIITRTSYIKLDIVQIDELEGYEIVGYLKTFWLKVIQRKWRKIYTKRKELIKLRSSASALRERQITGKWPKCMSGFC